MRRITTHPGDMLQHEFLEPMGLSARALARAMKVPPTRVTKLLRAETGMTADTALRLERVLGASAGFWLNLQTSYDLSRAQVTGAERYAELESLVAA